MGLKITAKNFTEDAKFKAELLVPRSSKMELNISDFYDSAELVMKITEYESADVFNELKRLNNAARALSLNSPDNDVKAVEAEARKVTEIVERSILERKWYSVSIEGLVDAAKAVGAIASPVVDSAIKVIDLLSKIKTR